MRYGIFSRVSGEAAQVQQFRFLSNFPSSIDALAEITIQCATEHKDEMWVRENELAVVKLGRIDAS